MKRSSADVVVVGGGIAGLSVARALSARAGLSVCLLEQERLLASHSSGRNAAIFRPLEPNATTAALCLRSLELLAALEHDAKRGLLRRSGLLLVSSEESKILDLARHGARVGVGVELLSGSSLFEAAPFLQGGQAHHAAWVPGGGVLDIDGLNTALARVAAARGCRLRTGCKARRIVLDCGRIAGVLLDDGQTLATGQVVLAAGAWNAVLAGTCGASLPLTPLCRHLVQLSDGGQLASSGTAARATVWRLEREVYLRPESSGVLASPCDEAPSSAGVPTVKPAALEQLAERLQLLAPRFGRLSVRSSWACLRTFARDRELVLGPDPRVGGLFWLAGLGGRGMAVGLAAGEILAGQIVDGADHPLAGVVRPARLLDFHGGTS
ncbi:MAG: FAD-binding oxidoreductase [Proteobacteria bacterium]|nr:FAD-binding oxidoreductase [Pseudomonadota bacterium]